MILWHPALKIMMLLRANDHHETLQLSVWRNPPYTRWACLGPDNSNVKRALWECERDHSKGLFPVAAYASPSAHEVNGLNSWFVNVLYIKWQIKVGVRQICTSMCKLSSFFFFHFCVAFPVNAYICVFYYTPLARLKIWMTESRLQNLCS